MLRCELQPQSKRFVCAMCTMRTVRQLHHEHIKSQKSGQKLSIIESRCTYFLVPLLVSMNIIFFRDKVGGGQGVHTTARLKRFVSFLSTQKHDIECQMLNKGKSASLLSQETHILPLSTISHPNSVLLQ